MTDTWYLGDLEFLVHWELLGEPLLHPFICTVPYTDYDEYEHAKFLLREKIRGTADHRFDEVFDALTHPDIRLVVRGTGESGPRLRINAVRKGELTLMVSQGPNRDIVIRDLVDTGLVTAITAELPKADAGRLGELTLASQDRGDDVDYIYGHSSVRAGWDDTVAHKTREFLNAPISHSGTIAITSSSRYGPRGVSTRHLEWRDLTDDGRYILLPRTPPVAVPADRSRVTTLLTQELTEIERTLHDDCP